MPDANANDRTWVSWVGIILFWAGALLLAIFVFGPQLHLGVRLGFTALFVVAGLTIALLDHYKVIGGTDRGPLDWFTIAHCAAGLMFGAWFLPLWWVLAVTISWEMFEASVPGWGMHEHFSNRWIDIAVALFGWILVAGIGAILTHGHLPFLVSTGSIVCKACAGAE